MITFAPIRIASCITFSVKSFVNKTFFTILSKRFKKYFLVQPLVESTAKNILNLRNQQAQLRAQHCPILLQTLLWQFSPRYHKTHEASFYNKFLFATICWQLICIFMDYANFRSDLIFDWSS